MSAPIDGLADLEEVAERLEARGTLSFRALENGLYPAAPEAPTESGYRNVWVRDNVFVAWAHYVNGRTQASEATAQSLARYFEKHAGRFQGVIDGAADPRNQMERPHIRFAGATMSELDEDWAHAQNDALGYFVWLFCLLAIDGIIEPTRAQEALLETFAAYFEAIRFWEDEDAGHWEEGLKVQASSIGVVVGGLRKMRELWLGRGRDAGFIEGSIRRGETALRSILPSECTQRDPTRYRTCDAALLFLIYPLDVVSGHIADVLESRVVSYLLGPHGIRRYLGDSYWCADYEKLFNPADRTGDFREQLARRNALLAPLEEAQWCIFDPILSAIHGCRYQRSGDLEELKRQQHYLRRALSQLAKTGPDGAPRCPEAYYLREGEYVPNAQTPLLWTQGNLWVALQIMKESFRIRGRL